MVTIKLVTRSAKDRKPTINMSELLTFGLISKKTKLVDGDVFLLKLSPIGAAPGILVEQEFQVSREGRTLYAKDGWNHYLFGMPSVGEPLEVNCAGALSAKEVKQLNSKPKQKIVEKKETLTISRPSGMTVPSKTELKSLLRQFQNNKTCCARYYDISPRTFGRWLEKRGL